VERLQRLLNLARVPAFEGQEVFEMKRIVLLTAILVPVFAGLASQAASAPPSKADLTIAAKPLTITFGQATTISGKVKGPLKDPVPVTLQQNPYPFTDGSFEDSATTLTAGNGDYAFSGVRPARNTRYRTTALVPPQTSAEVEVQVRIRVALHLSDRTPRAGQRVRFYGTAAPAHDGRTLRIQRQTQTGTWKTVARTGLRDAGDERSKFSRRVRVGRDGVYRARVYHDADHATGTSGRKSVDAHQ
jgi:hypothetical protein